MIGVVLFSYWCTTSSLQKGYLEIGSSNTLPHQLILEKPLKTYLTRTERRQESNPSGSHHHISDSVKLSRQWDQKFTRSLKPVRSPQNAVPKVQNQSNPKGNRGISLAAQRVRLSAPTAGGVVSFRGLGTETEPASLLGQKQNKQTKNTQNLSLNHYGGLFNKSWLVLSEFPWAIESLWLSKVGLSRMVCRALNESMRRLRNRPRGRAFLPAP